MVCSVPPRTKTVSLILRGQLRAGERQSGRARSGDYQVCWAFWHWSGTQAPPCAGLGLHPVMSRLRLSPLPLRRARAPQKQGYGAAPCSLPGGRQPSRYSAVLGPEAPVSPAGLPGGREAALASTWRAWPSPTPETSGLVSLHLPAGRVQPGRPGWGWRGRGGGVAGRCWRAGGFRPRPSWGRSSPCTWLLSGPLLATHPHPARELPQSLLFQDSVVFRVAPGSLTPAAPKEGCRVQVRGPGGLGQGPDTHTHPRETLEARTRATFVPAAWMGEVRPIFG